MTVRALPYLPLQAEMEVAAAMFSLLCRFFGILCPALPVIRALKYNYNMESLRLKSLVCSDLMVHADFNSLKQTLSGTPRLRCSNTG